MCLWQQSSTVLRAKPWGQAVYPLWCLSLMKDMQTEQLFCWSGVIDTEHSTISGSNEKYQQFWSDTFEGYICQL